MKLVLIGSQNTKRTEYFLKAAHELQESVTFIPMPNVMESTGFDFTKLKNCIVKVDPPLLDEFQIEKLSSIILWYQQFFLKLSKVPNIKFLNDFDAIFYTLDKLVCKQILHKASLPVTPLLAETVTTYAKLKSYLFEKRISQVFIKPRFGSGATGVVAYRLNFKTGAEIIENIIQYLLSYGAVIEKWIPKEFYHNKAYDLRVLFQFDHISFMVARQSKGSITNLHLNNHALPIENLHLDDEAVTEIEVLCRNAVALFPNLNVAGIDILLEKHTKKPHIIEINGQGDLLYLDIYHKNKIYKEQIKAMQTLNQKY